jgi:mannose-6-phosphate isomerase-like protein (cupin superfamily)
MNTGINEIKNSLTGQSIRFLNKPAECSGSRLHMTSRYPPFSKEPPEHYHPYQTEYFTVLLGEITFRINGKILHLKKDEKITVFPNDHHSMWNNSGEVAIVDWQVFPALQTETFLRKITQLANQPGADLERISWKLKGLHLLAMFSDTFRLTGVPVFVIKGLRVLLRSFSHMDNRTNHLPVSVKG